MKLDISILLVLFCLIHSLDAFGQTKELNVQASRITTAIDIDGNLDEEAWAQAETVTDFITWSPNPGLEPDKQSHVKVIYDDNAFYIGAYLEEKGRENIRTQLTQRDELGNTDWFGLMIDTYGNASSAFEFIVGSTGVQFDAILANGEDDNWDAVWFSAVSLTEDGWYVEIRIPYSAIRFAKAPVQEWKINFMRKINRLDQRSSWYPIDPQAPVWLAQMGTIQGIRDIKPPLRLSVSPYVSLYSQHYSDKANDFSSSGFSYNGGMDLKYGINDAFTLDMTLIPDFGQTESDDQVLNLSPFEVRFDEKRQFFTEGTELFEKGGLFYSRRVGGTPIGRYDIEDQLSGSEDIISNPNNAQLYNATKLSGRAQSGLGVGVFNAISKSSFAVVRDTVTNEERMVETAPITNYNVFVLDQNLGNNSSVSLVNTNVVRFGNSHYDANVTGLQFDIKTKEQKWSIEGEAALSQKYYAEADNVFGLAYEIELNKISGNLNYSFEYSETGEDFDPNDLGFQRFGNQREFSFNAFYGQYEPFGPFQRGNFWFNYNYSRIINPDVYSDMHINTGWWMQTKNFLNLNMWANYEPTTYNYYEPRVWGMYYKEPAWGSVGFWMGSDDRKKIRLSGYVDYRKTHEEGRYGISFQLQPRIQFSDRFTLSWRANYDYGARDPRYVTEMDGNQIIFGRRNRTTVTNNVSADYSFSSTMGLDFRLRHYWSKITYDEFNTLGEDGLLSGTDYSEFNDFSFGVLTIDLNYKWRFSPGSDLIINWKNNINGSVEDSSIDYRDRNYFKGIGSLKDFPQNNTISLRLVYYLDYQQIDKML